MNEKSQKTILLVEDDFLQSMTTKTSLEAMGYAVATANCGEKAIEIVNQQDCLDLILMDIDLGRGIDGTEAARAILGVREIPVVFLSSHAEPEIVEKTEKITSYGYVVKSSSTTVLDASIKMAFKLFESNRKLKDSTSRLEIFATHMTLAQKISMTGSFDYNIEKNEVFWSEEMFQVFGMKPQYIPLTIDEVRQRVHPDDRQIHLEQTQSIIDTGSYTFEHRVVWDDGSIHTILGNAKMFYETGGSPSRMLGTAQDITERKQSNLFLKAKEEQYKLLFDAIPESVLLIGTDSHVITANKASALLYGYESPQQLEGFDTRLLIAEKDRERAMRIQRDVFKGEEVSTRYYIEVRRDGSEFDAEIKSKTIYGPQKEVLGYIGITRDITQIMAVEKRLRASETFSKRVVENITDVIGIIGIDGKIKYKSSIIEKCFGWRPEDLVGTEGWQTVHPDDLERIKKEFYDLMKEENSIRILEYRYKCKDGDFKLIQMTARNLMHDAAINGVLMNYHDITERRENENALKQSRRDLEDAQEIGRIGKFVYNIEAGRWTSSTVLDNILGIEGSFDRSFKGWEGIIHPEDRERISASVKNAIENSQRADNEYRIVRPKDGVTAWVHATGEVISGIPGQAHSFIGTFQDITDRMRREEELKNTKALLQAALDNVQVGIAIADAPDGKLRYVNEMGLQIQGGDSAGLVDGVRADSYVSTWQLYNLDGTILEDSEVPLTKAITYGEKSSSKFIIKRSDGECRIVVAKAAPIFDEKGNVVSGIVAFMDITEQNNLKVSLAASENRLRLALGNAPFPIMVRTDDGKVEMVNAKWKELTGYTDEDIPTVSDWMKRAYGERHSKIRNPAIESETIMGLENHGDFTIITKSGETLIWDFGTSSLGKLADGRKAAITIALDVTERRQSEKRINELLTEKEILLREVNHRTKNNMNMIFSLLSIQASTTKDPLAVTALKEAASRVQAIQDLYVLLVGAEDQVALHSGDYFPRLIEGVMECTHHVPITVEKNIEDFVIGMRELPPLGLIVNELLTNAMKHAFAGRSEGKVTIEISKMEDQASIVISDDGVGIPESINLEETTGFGLLMIKGLVQQIDGTISIERGTGTTFRIGFKLGE